MSSTLFDYRQSDAEYNLRRTLTRFRLSRTFEQTGIGVRVNLYPIRLVVYWIYIALISVTATFYAIYAVGIISINLFEGAWILLNYRAFLRWELYLAAFRISMHTTILYVTYMSTKLLYSIGLTFLFPEHDWKIPYESRLMELMRERERQSITLKPCNRKYQEPEWMTEFAIGNTDDWPNLPMLAGKSTSDNTMIVSGSIATDTIDTLKDTLALSKKLLKRSVSTQHVLNDVCYKEILARIGNVALTGRVVAEIGGHKGSMFENTIRIVTDLEEGDGVRAYAHRARERNELDSGASHKWVYTDFFNYEFRLDVVICVFVMGMDMRKFFAHCYNLGVDTIIFTTAVTSNFIERGFMCTAASQLLTMVEGDKVRSYFNENEKIYSHDLVDYFIPLVVGNVVFSGHYYRREPLASVDSNIVFMYTLQTLDGVNPPPVVSTFTRGVGEHAYTMLEEKVENTMMTCLPIAISHQIMHDLDTYHARAKGEPQRMTEMITAVIKTISDRHPVERDGGFLKFGDYVMEIALALKNAKSHVGVSRFGVIGDTLALLRAYSFWVPYSNRVVKTTTNIKLTACDLRIGRELITFENGDKETPFGFDDRGQMLTNMSRGEYITNDALTTYSWISPSVPRKFKLDDCGSAASVLFNGSAHILHLWRLGQLDLERAATKIFSYLRVNAVFDGVTYTCDSAPDGEVLSYNCAAQKVVKTDLAQTSKSISKVQMFVLLFIGLESNTATEQCYRVAWGMPTVEPAPVCRADIIECLTGEESSRALLYENRIYSNNNDCTNLIMNIGEHAYRVKTGISDCANVLNPLDLPAEMVVKGIKLDVEFVENMRINYEQDVRKIKVPKLGKEKVFKESIVNYFSYECEHEVQWLGKLKVYETSFGVDKLKSDGLVGVYDNHYGHLVGTADMVVQNAGWDGKKYVTKDSDSTIFNTEERYVFMSEELTFLRALSIRDMLHKFHAVINNMKFSNLKMVFVNGVPGCGKTFTIAHQCRKVVNGVAYMPAYQMILTASLGGKKAYEEYEWLDQNQVRTYDSILINYATRKGIFRKVTELYCDEAMMAHFGQILTVIALIKPESVKMYGDKQQIPFLNRVVGFIMKGSVPHSMRTEYMLKTYRSPIYMLPHLALFYPDITTDNDLDNDAPQIILVKTQSKLQLYDFDVVLTFTQYEKSLLKDMGNTNVYTVHEMQGSSHNAVAIVRLIVQENHIYQSPAHIVVAISRHKTSLSYFTVDKNDTLSKLLRDVKIDSDEKPFVTATVTNRPATIAITEYKRKLRHDVMKPPGVFEQFYHDNFSPLEESVFKCDKTMFQPRSFKTIDDVHLCVVNGILGTYFEPYDTVRAEQLENEIMDDIPTVLQLHLVKVSEAILHEDKRVFCEPQLETPIHPVYNGKPGTLIHSIRKRNADPPTLLLANAWTNYIQIAHKWFDTFIDKAKFDTLILDYENNTFFRDWYGSRNENQLAALHTDAEKYNVDVKRYNGILKPLPKPVLNNAHNLTLAAPQVITSMQPLPTAYFAQYMKAFSFYLKQCLKEQWWMNDGLDGFTLSAVVNNMMAASESGKVKVLESDISKFDKSQELGSLIVVSAIMRLFKMPEEVIANWEECHIRNIIVFKQAGISLYTDFQRRSGDILTFIGNTLVTMALTVDAFDLSQAIGGVFGGDDSLVIFRDTADVTDTTERVTSVFNFMIKLEHFPSAVTFASKFLIYWENVWVLMPDAMKVITKLGRNDIRNKEHARLYYDSFCEVNSLYSYRELRLAMAQKIEIRYHKELKITFPACVIICDFIGSLIGNKKKFLALYKMLPNSTFPDLPFSFLRKFVSEHKHATTYDRLEDYYDWL